MSSDPLYIQILDKLGVNTTRLKWKLYKKEQQIKDAARGGIAPKGPSWWSYQHKVCASCGSINDAQSKQCHSCEKKLPPVWLYKISRLFRSSSSSRSPIVVPGFLGLMLLFFAVQVSLGGFEMGNIMQPSGVGMIILGAFTADIFSGPFHAFRWMAFGLLHGGLIHIGFNGYALKNVGPFIEGAIGPARMLVVITVSQLASALASYIQYFVIDRQEQVMLVGASGWLFGIIGFGIILFHRMGQIPIRNQLMFWTGLMLLIGFVVPVISNSAHVGGMCGGMMIAVLPMGGDMRRPWIDRVWVSAAVVSGVLWLVTMVFMFMSVVMNAPKYL
jgi:rhomboid protease GluP